VLKHPSTAKVRKPEDNYLSDYMEYEEGTCRNDDYKKYFRDNKPEWLFSDWKKIDKKPPPRPK
jgi:hypothetical protein